MKVIEFTVMWKDLNPSLWPNRYGTIFILPIRNNRFGVFEWVEDEQEHVQALGEFWKIEHARMFANEVLK